MFFTLWIIFIWNDAHRQLKKKKNLRQFDAIFVVTTRKSLGYATNSLIGNRMRPRICNERNTYFFYKYD